MSRRAPLNVVWAERTALRRLDPACFDAVARVRVQQAVSPVTTVPIFRSWPPQFLNTYIKRQVATETHSANSGASRRDWKEVVEVSPDQRV